MFILGLGYSGHDSAASIIEDGRIIAAALEERFNEIKHSTVFPVNAINYCLKETGVTLKDIDYVGFQQNPASMLYRFSRRHSNEIQFEPDLLYAVPNHLLSKMISDDESEYVSQEFNFFNRSKKIKFYYVDHHLAHLMNCYYVSKFDRAAIMTIDGRGDGQCSTLAIGEGNNHKFLKRIKYPHSLGLLYGAITEYLGFKPNNCEGKIMGLAPYGEPRYIDVFRDIVHLAPDGSYEIDLSYMEYYMLRPTRYSKKLVDKLGEPRQKDDPLDQRHKDIAASLQLIVEEAGLHMANWLYEQTNCKNLCLSGGVVLNSVMNGRILNETPFEEIFIQPAAGDAGCTLGAALFIYHKVLNNPRNHIMTTDYLGPYFTNEEIKKELESSKLNYVKLDNPAKFAAQLIAENKIIGWFQGRMEFGPRALGNRSILADPKDPNMKDKLNKEVKHRESFRPFAPSVIYEESGKYFSSSHESPYMLLVFDVKPEWIEKLPAITHVDGTARVQTVKKEDNVLYYELLEELKKITGIGMVLNTSFNIRGMPIVATISQAIKSYLTTGLDYLIIGNYMLSKKL